MTCKNEQATERAYRFDGDKYLDMHLTFDGEWDYTLYDKRLKEIDGGRMGENNNLSIDEAKSQILEMHGYKGVSIIEVDKERFDDCLLILQSIYQ